MSTLPTGTVTFLFADVEGSTRLARELGEGWQPVLADLRRLLREAVAAADGSEVDSRGDELFAVFAEAETAAQAAVEAQRQIAGHTWPTPVRVRIGLHTGAAALGEDGYVGVEVHRAFRIANAGHGGQIVASETTALVLTPDRELRDLGLWALPELPEPERIFQLEEPGLGGDFPALRARPGATPVRVVLADDSVLLREGVARLLDDAGFDVVAQSGNADDLLRHVAMHKPDVAVVDIRMPPTQTDEGLRAAKEIREQPPRDRACSCSRSTSSPATRWTSSPTAPRASATCSRTASPTSTSSPPPCGASPRAARRSTRPSSASSSAATAATTRLPSSRHASARCWS